MIFNFKDGSTRNVEAGDAVRGLRDVEHGRPVSITLDSNDLLVLSYHPEYVHTLSHTLASKKKNLNG